MNQPKNSITIIIFILLAVIILLQVNLHRKNSRIRRGLEGVAEFINRPSPGENRNEKKPEGFFNREGDWLVWGFGAEPKTLNQIHTDSDIYSRWITTPYILEPLLDYDYDTMKLTPCLAESYSISEDGLEITFILRNDIYFSDGMPVTSDDVIFTYKTIMNPEIDAASIAQQYADVDRVMRINEKQVRFIMKRSFFKTMDNLSFVDTGIFPEHVYRFDDPSQFNERISNPVGSGPYVFEKWNVGREIVLKRNENYWGTKPNFKKVIYRFITNTVAGLQALQSGQVDIMIPEPEQFTELKSDPDFNKRFYCLSYYEPRVPFFFIGWNMDTPCFKDRRVRLAMTHLIDREKIIETLMQGEARIVSGPFYSQGGQNNPDIEPWPYDPERAKELLDEAGWTDTNGDGIRDRDGKSLRFKFIYTSSSSLYRMLAKLLKDEAAKAGIHVDAEPYEWSVLITRLSDREFESMVMGWGGDMVDDPYQIFHSTQIENRASNYVGFSNSEADRLMEEARMTLDEIERNNIFHKIHLILHEEQPYTFLFERPYIRLIDRRFKNLKVHKKGVNWLEWYVPEELRKYK